MRCIVVCGDQNRLYTHCSTMQTRDKPNATLGTSISDQFITSDHSLSVDKLFKDAPQYIAAEGLQSVFSYHLGPKKEPNLGQIK